MQQRNQYQEEMQDKMGNYNECKYWHQCERKKTYVCITWPKDCLEHKILEKTNSCKEVKN